ncbi:MAG TPA: ABC transporter permease [Candidatus Sulfotelmatobacter sp.]
MNIASNAMPGSAFEAGSGTPAINSPTRPLYWSIRREVWENRSIYLVPLAVAVVFLFGFLISAIHPPGKLREMLTFNPMQEPESLEQPYNFAALLMMGTTLIVGIFYCLDALYGERRDRSILFWKSLPVSDLTIVLSKASIPLAVLPLLTFVIILATQWLMLLMSTAVLWGRGESASMLWTQLPFFQMSLLLLYHLVAVHVLSYAPMYCWLLLVSAWARRAAFLWAALPVLAIGILEKLIFNTGHFASLLGSRASGGPDAPDYPEKGNLLVHSMAHLTPVHFLTRPGLWFGLLVAAAFLAAAVRLRRSQGPI